MPIITLPSFHSARLFLKSEGSPARRDQCDRAALSFAALLLVRFLCTLKGIKASKENEQIKKLISYESFFKYL